MGGLKTVYLDYASSAPLRSCVIDAEAAYANELYAGANPNSLHSFGRMQARSLDEARHELASILAFGFRPQDIVFTSGGTEANNLALLGVCRALKEQGSKRNRVIVSAIEHDSCLACIPELRAMGFSVSLLKPTRQGVCYPEALEELIDDDVCLVSVMAANNETGIVQPIDLLGKCAHAHGALFHSDCVQAFCKIPLDLSSCDCVSITAHKLGGPVGIGALAIRANVPLKARSFGGEQENRRRAGTQDVRGARMFAHVARFCADKLEENQLNVQTKAQYLLDRLLSHSKVELLCSVDAEFGKLHGIVSVCVRGHDSQTLLLHLDKLGFCVSAGSACSSHKPEPSHVLKAMAVESALLNSVLRISFDERVSNEDLASFANTLLSLL